MSAGIGATGAPPRRAFFQAAWGAAAVLLAWGWGRMGLARRGRQGTRRVSLPMPRTDGLTLHGDVVLAREGGRVSAFDSRCPHLGCRITRIEDGLLVCPCHGSRFDAGGRRVAGPAATGLRPLPLARSSDTQKVEVDVLS